MTRPLAHVPTDPATRKRGIRRPGNGRMRGRRGRKDPYLKPTRVIWLFGENLGATMNNNSWYTFRHVVLHHRHAPVKAYFAVRRTPATEERVRELPERLRRRIVWHGSQRHLRVFHRADRFFLTLSFGDVEPDEVGGRSTRRVPITHLQHGTIGVKRVGYHGDYYRGMLDTFCIYSAEERELLETHNGFRPEQLYEAPAQPRYAELLRRQSERRATPGSVLWFLTWRDYLHHDSSLDPDAFAQAEDRFAHHIIDALTHPKTLALVPDEFTRVTVALHQYFDPSFVQRLRDRFRTLIFEKDHPAKHLRGRVQFFHGAEVDLMDLIVEAELLVSDYSSLPFDFTFLGKSVALYRFDVDDYLAHRDTYVDLNEVFTELVAFEPDEFAHTIRAARGTTHSYYRARVQAPADAFEWERIAAGATIDRLIEYHLERDVPVLELEADRAMQGERRILKGSPTQNAPNT